MGRHKAEPVFEAFSFWIIEAQSAGGIFKMISVLKGKQLEKVVSVIAKHVEAKGKFDDPRLLSYINSEVAEAKRRDKSLIS